MSILQVQANRHRAFWNNLGNPSEGLTGKKALERFGLDWEPQAVPIEYKVDGCNFISKDFRLLINSKTKQTLCPITTTWQPLGNREFYNRAEAAIGAFGGNIDRGGYLHGSKASLRTGERCAFLISNEVPELAYELFGDRDEGYITRIVFYNHHSPGSGIGAKLVSIRWICINGMVSTAQSSTVQAAHTKAGVEEYRAVEKELAGYKLLIYKQKTTMEHLAQTEVSISEAREHFINLVGNKKQKEGDQPIAVKVLEAIYDGSAVNMLNESLEDVGADLSLNDYTNGTAYGVLQAVTAYQSHLRGGYSTPENAIRSKVFTDSAALSQKAYTSLSRLYVPQHVLKQQNQQSVGVRAF